MGSTAPGTETAGENTETVGASETPPTAARTGTTESARAHEAEQPRDHIAGAAGSAAAVGSAGAAVAAGAAGAAGVATGPPAGSGGDGSGEAADPGAGGAPVAQPLLEPREGVPPVVSSEAELARVVEAFAKGSGPVAV
ncbi:hypothetical protein AB0J52_41080, partial [Spirillospora sp. NPDC049652]